MGEAIEKTGSTRDEQGRFIPGVSGNPEGRKPMTEEQKLEKEARKLALDGFIEEYTTKLTEALPEISPVLIEKAKSGDMVAIKELHDRVMGKAPQNVGLTDGDGNPFSLVIKRYGDEDNEPT